MKKLFLIIIVCIFAISGCTNKEKGASDVSLEKSGEETVYVAEQVSTPYSNPAIIYGSDFMSFMQSLRKIGDYETLFMFTATKSVAKHGKDKVVTYYKDRFTNMSKLELKGIVDNENGSKTMNYTNLSAATKIVAPITIVIENDSCKLVLPENLNTQLIN